MTKENLERLIRLAQNGAESEHAIARVFAMDAIRQGNEPDLSHSPEGFIFCNHPNCKLVREVKADGKAEVSCNFGSTRKR